MDVLEILVEKPSVNSPGGPEGLITGMLRQTEGNSHLTRTRKGSLSVHIT